MGLARTVLSSPSGFLVESFGWTNFFLSIFLGIPAIFVLFWMKKTFNSKCKSLINNIFILTKFDEGFKGVHLLKKVLN